VNIDKALDPVAARRWWKVFAHGRRLPHVGQLLPPRRPSRNFGQTGAIR
jgi:hypothetical protein